MRLKIVRSFRVRESTLDQFAHRHGAGDASLIIAVFDGIGQTNRFYIPLQLRDKFLWQVVGEEQLGDAG